MDRLRIFRRSYNSSRPGRLVDLGTGHGKFALTARDHGWQITAVDAGTERTPRTDGIEWIRADVRHFPTSGYDRVSILGLLYHFELDDQLLPLETVLGSQRRRHHFSFNPMVQLGVYQGQWFEEDLSAPTASWGNQVSFWPTEPDLIRMFNDCGYGYVWCLTPGHHETRNGMTDTPAPERPVPAVYLIFRGEGVPPDIEAREIGDARSGPGRGHLTTRSMRRWSRRASAGDQYVDLDEFEVPRRVVRDLGSPRCERTGTGRHRPTDVVRSV